MPLEPHELEKLDEIGKAVTRIDERTKRMDDETGRRFESTHRRIDEVKADLEGDVRDVRDESRRHAARVGGASGGLLGALSLVGVWFKDWYGG